MLLKDFKKEKLSVRVFDNRTAMGKDSAAACAATLREMLAKKDAVNVIFAAAPSQSDFLAALEREADIDWKRVNVFHMDEYIGIDNDHPQSFARFVKTFVADRFAVGAFYPLQGNAPDAEAECARYAALLQQFPTDIVCMGIGENGHIAFNDPWVADLDDPKAVKVVELDATCRQQQVNDGCFADITAVPTHAMTLTVPTLCAADYHFCMVPAPTKANAVQHTLNDTISADCPATVLRRLDKAVLYLDSDSAALI